MQKITLIGGNPKFQIPKPKQVPNTNSGLSLGFGAWDLGFFAEWRVDLQKPSTYALHMAKRVVKVIKVRATGGAASPGSGLGPALGQAGVDIGGFVSKFNAATKDRQGQLLPVQITVYEDRSFTFKVKSPPASTLILQELKLEKGSGEPNKNKIGSLTRKQVEKIAEAKMTDLNARDVAAAVNIIAGTARSMGVSV